MRRKSLKIMVRSNNEKRLFEEDGRNKRQRIVTPGRHKLKIILINWKCEKY